MRSGWVIVTEAMFTHRSFVSVARARGFSYNCSPHRALLFPTQQDARVALDKRNEFYYASDLAVHEILFED